MTTSRIKLGILLGLLAIFATPANAQTPPVQTPPPSNPAAPAAAAPQTDGRDASFLPPGSAAPLGQPVPLVPETPAAPTNSSPALSMPSPAVPPTPDTGKPVELSQPVQSESLQSINPDSIGLLSAENGGFGAAMWKGTSLDLVMRILPQVMLPTASAALNDLAQRFLLTTANVPEGTSDSTQTLTSIRVEKLITLGDAGDAWTLALLKPDRVDEITLRLAAEAALISGEGKEVCAKLPDIIHTHTSPEWQKALVVCQLRDNDSKGAQLSLEVLHAQGVKDDAFFEVAERNILGGSKLLPRQLTPLQPLTAGLLVLTGDPLPPELFARPDASEIPILLQAKARDDVMRLSLAERAAERGIIGATQLAAAYGAVPFSADELANVLNGSTSAVRLRALLYQAASNEKDPQRRLEEIAKFVQSLDSGPLNNVTATLLADLVGNILVTDTYQAAAPTLSYIFVTSGRLKEALAWLKLARQATANSPAVAAQLQSFWPLVVLAGLETDSDYSPNLHAWAAAGLKDADYTRREQIGDVLSLFEAAGFAVPEDVWAPVMDASVVAKRSALPSIPLLEGLRTASAANRRGETVLLSLALANPAPGEIPSILPTVETVRALRLVGLTADSLMLARETAAGLLGPSQASVKP